MPQSPPAAPAPCRPRSRFPRKGGLRGADFDDWFSMSFKRVKPPPTEDQLLAAGIPNVRAVPAGNPVPEFADFNMEPPIPAFTDVPDPHGPMPFPFRLPGNRKYVPKAPCDSTLLRRWTDRLVAATGWERASASSAMLAVLRLVSEDLNRTGVSFVPLLGRFWIEPGYMPSPHVAPVIRFLACPYLWKRLRAPIRDPRDFHLDLRKEGEGRICVAHMKKNVVRDHVAIMKARMAMNVKWAEGRKALGLPVPDGLVQYREQGVRRDWSGKVNKMGKRFVAGVDEDADLPGLS